MGVYVTFFTSREANASAYDDDPAVERDLLRREAARFGVTLDDAQIDRFDALAVELIRFNEKINVTAIVQPDDIVRKHFADSLAFALTGIDPDGLRAIDVGAGAGFPSLPLLIAFDGFHIIINDSVEKKLAFSARMIDLLGLDGGILPGRAEALAFRPEHREQYDLALSRAVARWRIIDELTLPFVRPGGKTVLYKGNISSDEKEEGLAAEKVFGVSGSGVPYTIGGEARVLIVTEKTSPMGSRFPRPYAKIRNKAP